MPRYEVRVSFTQACVVEIDAKTKEAALTKAEDMFEELDFRPVADEEGADVTWEVINDLGGRQCACMDCDWNGRVDQLGTQFDDITDLSLRISPGEVAPAGECPKCFHFAYLVE